MAHIKVVRRSMRPEEWTDLRFGWLKRHIYSSKWEIKNLMVRDARQISEMEYEYYPEDYHPLNKGDMYFTPDGTAFSKPMLIFLRNFREKNSGFLSKPPLNYVLRLTANISAELTPTVKECCFHRMLMINRPSILK